MLIDEIKAKRIEAMKARNTVGKTLLTTLLGELEGAAKRDGSEITDDKVIAACKKFISGNIEVIEAGAKIGSECPNLLAENLILETYIPKQLTEEQLYAIIVELKADNMGAVMQHLKGNYNGLYNGKLAANVAHHVLG